MSVHDGRRVYLHLRDSLGSTNDEARALVEAGEPAPLAVRARVQTAGRGRRGAVWDSPAGGLWITFADLWEAPPPPCTALRVARALHATIASEFENPERVRIKWPNDLLVEGRKCAGVLCESHRAGGQHLVLIGVGVNADFEAAQLPDRLRFPATTLREALGRPVDTDQICDRFVDAMGRVLERRDPVLTGEELRALIERLAFLDQDIRVRRPDGSHVVATLEGLAPDGRAALRAKDGGILMTDAGEFEAID